METKESRETKNKRRDSFFVSMIGTRAASSIRADFSAMGMDPNFFFEKSIKSASQTTRTLKIFSTVFSKLTNFSFQKRTSYFNAGFSEVPRSFPKVPVTASSSALGLASL